MKKKFRITEALTKTTARARARMGATFLDLVRPGWETELKLDELDLSNCYRCVLGQLFGEFGTGARKLFVNEIITNKPCTDALTEVYGGPTSACGFVVMVDHDKWANAAGDFRKDSYDALDEAWRHEVTKRLPKQKRA